MKIRILLSALLLTVATVLASCGGGGYTPQSTPKPKTHYVLEEYFDTVCAFSSYLGDTDEEFASNCEELENILERYHKLFDIYYEYSGVNNLRTVNIAAGKNPVKVDRELIDFLIYCKESYTVTRGEVNVMMGSVLRLWNRCLTAEDENGMPAPRIPTEAELAEAAKHISIDSLVINEEESTVYITDPKASIDVGALGKGYVANIVTKHLTDKGVSSYLLNVGGIVCAIGTQTNGEAWITGITNPDRTSSDRFVEKIYIKETSIVTSGDYHRYYYVDDVKYHHIIDKDTLMPAEYFTSVSIVTKDSALADALSTALFAMSYEDGLELVNSLGGVEVLWVDREYKTYMTDGFKALVINE